VDNGSNYMAFNAKLPMCERERNLMEKASARVELLTDKVKSNINIMLNKAVKENPDLGGVPLDEFSKTYKVK